MTTDSPTPPATMRASVLLPDRSLILEERPVPALDLDQVLVRVGAVGICGSDVHYYHEGRIGDFIVDAPMILGHEAGGVIAAVGSAVDPARIGSRVSIEPQRPGATSRETLEGNYNLDPEMEFYATPPIDGAFAEFAVIQSHFAHDIPEQVSDEAAALMEPLSVGIAAARKAQITAGSRVLIAGAGPIGVIIAQVARAYGALEIIISDLSEARREQALKFGATRALDPRTEDVTTLAVDAFIDASGAAPAITAGLRAVRPAGRVVLVGMGAPEISLPVSVIQNNELIVTGIFRYTNTWPLAIALVAAGRVDLDGLVTGRFGLEEVEEALGVSTRESSLKTMVYPGR
ncbi:NAD(P)-dependent alcohol dehydrogenase [Mycetocola spongiae]|uniref:NAD(P)-dependent alcohol dehydrogenase n=1 Tax=Mycetocola spongiae TaxID=2859226 RepID=UPI001CF24AA0|nr:NAD(P)-dependent alcohol dehydrogenase [Mycetocola spongiae]UCR90288.1 NAD(P)-dependent alcohol dehydrogenase [Mycetocola spongiae]